MNQLDLLSGPHLRDQGAALVAGNTPEEWAAACDVAIERLAHECRAGVREHFTAEDVREQVGDPPNHPNSMGAFFLRAKRRGTIRVVGYATATRPEAHACRLTLYTAGPTL